MTQGPDSDPAPDPDAGSDGRADPQFEDRVRDALRNEADSVAPDARAWANLTARLGARDVPGTEGSGPAPERRTPPVAGEAAPVRAPRRRSWRPPLIAAAAVVIVAGAAGVLIARNGGGDAAGRPASPCTPTNPVLLPVDASGGAIYQSFPGTLAPSSAGAATALVTTPGAITPAVTMGFDRAPHVGSLCTVFDADGSTVVNGNPSDGTPLGYLSVVPMDTQRYLVLAVGPKVEQVDILAPLRPASTAVAPSSDIDPGFSPYSARWVVDGGVGPEWSTGDTTTTRWTDLGDGWHGFVIEVPVGIASADVIAYGAHGAVTQRRSVDLFRGTTTDQTLPPETLSPSPGTGLGPVPASPAVPQVTSASVLASNGGSATAEASGCANVSGGVEISGTGLLMATPGGPPPDGILCVGRATSGAEDYVSIRSDGTPLGYVSVILVGGRRYLAGAVGPEVAQVQVRAMPSAATVSALTASMAGAMTATTRPTTQIDPGFATPGEMWIIDGGTGTPWSTAEAATTRWTGLGDGWHGFALAVAADAVTADVATLGGGGDFTQVRTIDVTTGGTSDHVPPSGTALPSSRSTTEPTSGGAIGTGASACAGIADGLGISDVGFGLAGVVFRRDGHGGLCFLDASSGLWSYAPQRSGPIGNAGITGPGTVVDQADGKRSTARLVWGAVTSDVVAVRAKAADGVAVIVSGGLVDLGQTRVFLIRVPATGAVTVTAVDGSGQAMGAVTLP